MTSRTNLKLVSFDAGGVQGLSQLEIMENIMHHLNWEKQSKGLPPSLPCEYFDLMGGSGTGGLISIMFAKLRMTVEEASKEFCTIAEEVYKKTDIAPSERTQRLRVCMGDIMNKRGLPSDMKLLDGMQTGGCACFVVTSPRINAGTKLCLRSYPVRNHLASAITVVDAVLATCAMQPSFAPVSVGMDHKRKEYIGAGLGASNPVHEVIAEAHSLFGEDSTVASLLSVGSGHPGVITISSDGGDGDLYKALQDMMHDCTEKAREIKQKIGRSGIYYRFSVEQGMQCDHPPQSMDLGWIVTQTESYIEEHVEKIEAFAKNYDSPICKTTLGQLKSGNVQAVLPANLDITDIKDIGVFPAVFTRRGGWEFDNLFAETDNEAAILSKLRPSDFECSSTVGGCMEGTRQDILATLLHWTSDFRSPNIFWVKGHPGVGKSAIAMSLTDSLRKSNRLGSSFFFHRERPNVLTPNSLWRVIAFDLSRKYPTIRRRLLTALSANESLPTTLNIDSLFRELIHEPLTTCDNIPFDSSPIIVIDALDECGGIDGQHSEHRANLRRTLKSWSCLPRLFKLVVTSRGEADLEQLFSTISHIPLEISAGTAANPQSLEDIRKFFEDQLRHIVNQYQSELSVDWPGCQVVQELAIKSGGLFIWAKIIIGFINRGQPQEQLDQILAGTGAGGMATLYSWILKVAFPHPSEKVIKAFHAFVGTIILAKNPLPASAIMNLWSIDSLTMKYIRNGLQSIMTSTDVPRFRHQSSVDFLLDPANCPPVFLIDQNDQNRRLTLQCLQTMKTHLRFNICEIESSYYRNSDIPDLASKVEERILPHISYSCCFWANHLIESRFDLEIYDSLGEFMQERLLFWMEVLSLIKRVNLGSSMMRLLIDWLQAAGRDAELALDMTKFISTFGSVISQSTAQIYLSALPFSPQKSLISRIYRRSHPQTIAIRSGGQKPIDRARKDDFVRCILTQWKLIVSGSYDEMVRIWDAETGEIVAGPSKGHTSYVTSVVFSADGKYIASGSYDETVLVWNVETAEVVTGLFNGHHRGVTSVAFSPDGKHITSGSFDETIILWDAKTAKVLIGPFRGHTGSITSVAFSPDGTRVVSASADMTIRIWDADTAWTIVGPFKGHTLAVTSVAFSPNGRFIVSGSEDKTIRIWDAKSADIIAGKFGGHDDVVTSVAFSPNGKYVVSGSWDMAVKIWDVKTAEVVAGPFKGHTDIVMSVAFSPDGRRIISGSQDKTICVWDAESTKVAIQTFEGHSDVIESVSFSPDGKRIISGSRDNTALVWDLDASRIVSGPFVKHTDCVTSIALSPNGNHIASGSRDTIIWLWDAETVEVIAGPFQGHNDVVTSVAFSCDGKYIASGSYDETVLVWDVDTAAIVAGPFEGHADWVTSVAFSPDGTRIVSGSRDETIIVWDVAAVEAVAQPFEGHTDMVTSVAFSPNGRRIVSGSDDRTLRVWDVGTGELVIRVFEGHAGPVTSVVFSPNGRHIASGSYDYTIMVWDAETAAVVAGPYRGHTNAVASVAFSPDGKHIVSGSYDATIRVWNFMDSILDPPLFTDSSKMVDGWILGPNSELLFWIPPELRTGLWRPGNAAVIGRFITTDLNRRRFAHGESWVCCKDPPSEGLT